MSGQGLEDGHRQLRTLQGPSALLIPCVSLSDALHANIGLLQLLCQGREKGAQQQQLLLYRCLR